MRIRHQFETACLAFLMTLNLAAGAADPSKVDALVEKVKIFSSSAEIETTGNEILKLDPLCGDALAMLAWNKYRAGNLNSAIDLDKKAIGLKFRSVFWQKRAHNCLYHCYIDKRDWKQALSYCEQAYKVEHNSGVAHDLSILYGKIGNAKLSQEYAATAEKLSTDMRQKFDHMMLDHKQSNDPKTVDTILDRINEGLAKNPKDQEALLLRANCYRTKKLYAKEMKDINTLIGMAPEKGMYYHRRAEVYKALGNKKLSESDETEAKKRGFDADKIVAKFQKYLNDKKDKQVGTAGSGTTYSAERKTAPD